MDEVKKDVYLEIGTGRIVYPNGYELCRMPASCVTGEWIEKANRIVDSFNNYDSLKQQLRDRDAEIESLKHCYKLMFERYSGQELVLKASIAELVEAAECVAFMVEDVEGVMDSDDKQAVRNFHRVLKKFAKYQGVGAAKERCEHGVWLGDYCFKCSKEGETK
jgi:hypothetical protein